MTNILNDANLVEHWNLDEASGTRNGATGSYNLTANGAVGQGTGVVNECASFASGASEYLSADDSAIANYTQTNYTLSFWFKWFGGSHRIWTDETSDSYTSITPAGLITVKANNHFFLFDYGPLSANTWYHTAFSVAENGANYDYRCIANGSTVEDSTGQAGSGATWSTFRLGNSTFGATGFDNLVDHVSFFDRALSLSELGELYNGGSPPEYVAAASGVPGGIARTMHTTMSRSMVVNMGSSGD